KIADGCRSCLVRPECGWCLGGLVHWLCLPGRNALRCVAATTLQTPHSLTRTAMQFCRCSLSYLYHYSSSMPGFPHPVVLFNLALASVAIAIGEGGTR